MCNWQKMISIFLYSNLNTVEVQMWLESSLKGFRDLVLCYYVIWFKGHVAGDIKKRNIQIFSL